MADSPPIRVGPSTPALYSVGQTVYRKDGIAFVVSSVTAYGGATPAEAGWTYTGGAGGISYTAPEQDLCAKSVGSVIAPADGLSRGPFLPTPAALHDDNGSAAQGAEVALAAVALVGVLAFAWYKHRGRK